MPDILLLPPIQASSGPAQFWFPWQAQGVIYINLVAGFAFLLLFLPQDGQNITYGGETDFSRTGLGP